MALRWNLEGIVDADSVCWITAPEDIPMHGVKAGEQVMNPVTNVLIWATIGVDLGSITEKNAAEFFARLRFTERLDGPFLIRAEVDGVRPEGEAAFVTEEEVAAHIGLSCNVVDKSRTQWLKRFTNDLDRLASRFDSKRAEFSKAV
jgi:hypothetical protein